MYASHHHRTRYSCDKNCTEKLVGGKPYLGGTRLSKRCGGLPQLGLYNLGIGTCPDERQLCGLSAKEETSDTLRNLRSPVFLSSYLYLRKSRSYELVVLGLVLAVDLGEFVSHSVGDSYSQVLVSSFGISVPKSDTGIRLASSLTKTSGVVKSPAGLFVQIERVSTRPHLTSLVVPIAKRHQALRREPQQDSRRPSYVSNLNSCGLAAPAPTHLNVPLGNHRPNQFPNRGS